MKVRVQALAEKTVCWRLDWTLVSVPSPLGAAGFAVVCSTDPAPL